MKFLALASMTMMIFGSALAQQACGADGATCDDALACTANDVCLDSVCAGGRPLDALVDPPKPYVDAIRFVSASNAFEVVIKSAHVGGRQAPWLFQFVDASGAELPECTPIGGGWSAVTTADDASCMDTVSAQLTWSTLIERCGLVLDQSDANVDRFTGVVRVSQSDVLPAMRSGYVTRTTVTDIQYGFNLQKRVALSATDVQVFAPVSVLAAVVGATYTASSGTVVLRVRASVQAPFRFGLAYNGVSADDDNQWTVSALPSTVASPIINGTALATALTAGCTSGAAACEQTFAFAVAPIVTAQMCSADGVYGLAIDLGCRDEGQACPLLPSNDVAALAFTINTADLCKRAAFDGANTLQATPLQTFASAARDQQSAKSAFFRNGIVYARTVVSSTVADLVTAAIVNSSIAVQVAGFPEHIVAVAGIAATRNVDASPDSVTLDFQFALNGLDAEIGTDQNKPVTLRGALQVAYRAGTKRQASADLPAEVQFEGAVTVDAVAAKQDDAADSGAIANSAVSMLAAIAVTLLLMF